MAYTDYNSQLINKKPKIWLCKPNREPIAKIKDTYGEQLTIDLGAINKFSFTIPATIQRNHQTVMNPLVEEIRERFIIKLKIDSLDEYFIIMKINKNMENDGFESVTYEAYSTGFQISQGRIREYSEESKTLRELATDMLKIGQTNWKVDYIDGDANIKHRSFEVPSNNSLQSIFDLCQKFNVITTFDTVRKMISFHKPNNIGINKGLRLKEGIYLENFNLTIDPEKMITRVFGYGQDGLEFRSLSATGSNYIEDYSFFMYPFECDDNYNVIKMSHWMSNELCIALTKYKKLLASVEGQFKTLTEQSVLKKDEIQQKEQELSVIEAKINDLKNQRDMINYTYADQAESRPDWQAVIASLTAEENNANNKKQEITNKNTELDSIKVNINTLREQVKVSNNFTVVEIEEWQEYIIGYDYFNDSITDEKDLLEETKEIFKEVSQPPLNLTLSMDNFMANVDIGLNEKISIGDILTLKSKYLNVNVKAKITQMIFNYDAMSMSVTVANTIQAGDDFERLIDQLNLSASTSTTVDIDKIKWNDGREALDMTSQYINNALDSSKQLITGGLNNSVQLSERGLIAVDMLDPNAWLMIQNGCLFITPDNGNHVTVGISKNGVHAEVIAGKLVMGNKLHIESESGIVDIYDGRMSVYDQGKNLKVQVGTYPDPYDSSILKHGIRIYDGAFDIRTSDATNRGIQLDANGIRAYNSNGVPVFNVDSMYGTVSIIGSMDIRTSHGANSGIVIDGNGIKGYMGSGQIGFEIDNHGNANFGGKLTYATGAIDQVTGSVDNLTGSVTQLTGDIDGMTGTFAGLVTGSLSADTIDAIKIKADQIEALEITADMINVTDLSAISANIGTINTGTLNGVNINTEENVYVGQELIIGETFDISTPKLIRFGGGSGGITGAVIQLDADGILKISNGAKGVQIMNGTFV